MTFVFFCFFCFLFISTDLPSICLGLSTDSEDGLIDEAVPDLEDNFVKEEVPDVMKIYVKMKRVSKKHRGICVRSNRQDLKDIENVDNVIEGGVDTFDQSDEKIQVKDEMIGLILKRMNNM